MEMKDGRIEGDNERDERAEEEGGRSVGGEYKSMQPDRTYRRGRVNWGMLETAYREPE